MVRGGAERTWPLILDDITVQLCFRCMFHLNLDNPPSDNPPVYTAIVKMQIPLLERNDRYDCHVRARETAGFFFFSLSFLFDRDTHLPNLQAVLRYLDTGLGPHAVRSYASITFCFMTCRGSLVGRWRVLWWCDICTARGTTYIWPQGTIQSTGRRWLQRLTGTAVLLFLSASHSQYSPCNWSSSLKAECKIPRCFQKPVSPTIQIPTTSIMSWRCMYVQPSTFQPVIQHVGPPAFGRHLGNASVLLSCPHSWMPWVELTALRWTKALPQHPVISRVAQWDNIK